MTPHDLMNFANPIFETAWESEDGFEYHVFCSPVPLPFGIYEVQDPTFASMFASHKVMFEGEDWRLEYQRLISPLDAQTLTLRSFQGEVDRCYEDLLIGKLTL